MNNIVAVGYSYKDIYPNREVNGGVYNYPGKRCIIGYASCIYDNHYRKGSEVIGLPSKPWISKNYGIHLMYGDSHGSLKEIFNNDEYPFLSVDFSQKFKLLDTEILDFWAKRANILFCAIEDDQLYNKWPKLPCELILHCAEGVYYQCRTESYIVRNPYLDRSFKFLTGAGDVLAANILKGTITKTSILRAMKKTYLYLKDKNECLKNTT